MLEKAGGPVFESAVTQSKDFQEWWCGREQPNVRDILDCQSRWPDPTLPRILPVLCAPQVPHSVLVAIHNPCRIMTKIHSQELKPHKEQTSLADPGLPL